MAPSVIYCLHCGVYRFPSPKYRDSVSACWWFARASSSGVVRGSYNLGYMHEYGLGVPLDYRKALMFYDRASSTVADVDHNLTGMPIQLLVFIAKAR